MHQQSTSPRILAWLPSLGILLFFGLFGYSSTLYPGGSQADLNSIGYDWINNYWCNLMNENAMNEQINPARPYAIVAMIILCASLMLFFVQFALKISTSHFWKNTIKWCGIISMIFAMLMFTKYHDLMTILSSLFGLFMVIGIIWEVYKSGLTFFKITGIVCILLLGLNNYIYYSQQWIEHLPLVQKLTFLFVLGWIIGLNIKMNNKISLNSSQV